MANQKKKLPMLDERVPNRFCWECAHIYFCNAEPGYSEYTPGSNMQLNCGLDYWRFDQYDDTLGQLREKITKAEWCGHFKPSEKRNTD